MLVRGRRRSSGGLSSFTGKIRERKIKRGHVSHYSSCKGLSEGDARDDCISTSGFEQWTAQEKVKKIGLK